MTIEWIILGGFAIYLAGFIHGAASAVWFALNYAKRFFSR